MSDSMRQAVILRVTCPYCERSGFVHSNLRKHMLSHGIEIKDYRSKGFRRTNDQKYIYTSAEDPDAVVHHECIACDYHCVDVKDLKAHITQDHNVKSDEGVQLTSDDDREVESHQLDNFNEEEEENNNTISAVALEVLTKAYKLMREEQKWKLSTGKYVEDELYKFAKKCVYDHPSLSFILDPYDATYLQQGVFTEAEIDEMKACNRVIMEPLQKDVIAYLKLFNCTTTEQLRMACLKNLEWYQPFNRKEHFYQDWIRRTIDMMIAEFEAGSLNSQHSESWYMARIWTMIDRVFADVEDLETVRGESSSIATSTRKNQDRVIASMVKMKRKAMGRRGDLILRKNSAEYGCAEAGAKDEGSWGTKKLMEKGVKAAKTLKDMLNNLCDLVDNVESSVRQLRTIGYILSGLSMELMVMDSPMGYCCRITRSKLYSVPTSALQVRRKLLPLMSALISTKLLVLKVINEVEHHDLDDDDLEDSLANTFQEESSRIGSPKRTTIVFPTCNVTPTKRKQSST
ncbi:hypothetical protein K450DRAFT_275975 [Umbelopsis ramanniana AG]|uniref:C2H2-type domain-containing protein n=1 Tax=Umbelopsis ramanniana AG TaxID=1314678 RepID=A0AAD5E203_UMBRA|nr:uncharacterized protein K450DRAFT_275975 [Umbelopsis ramanniana AG]KAI8575045.1 hypothetical protein K450DRAFT_275975 [Umbelopsis ramanniana AG]